MIVHGAVPMIVLSTKAMEEMAVTVLGITTAKVRIQFANVVMMQS